MKTIQPVPVWKNGQIKEAVFLNSYVVSDNLKDSANFYYSILDENKSILAEGNIGMGGDTYQGWETNEYAWEWCANTLRLTITGDEPIQD